MSDQLVWRAVRCCCQPKKVMGFMRVREDATEIRLRENGGITRFPIMPLLTCLKVSYDIDNGGDIAGLDSYRKTEQELAIKSEDHPIEFWRRQPGFIENKEEG